MKITIVYDNKLYDNQLIPGWGFACVIEFLDQCILFDTGGNGAILLNNMEKLGINFQDIKAVFLSHAHGDHTNGLGSLLGINNNITVYLPQSFPQNYKNGILSCGAAVEEISQAQELFDGVFTTGEITGAIPEQALAFRCAKGQVVITGCAHPGVVNIVQMLKKMTGDDVYLVLGGFHFPKQSVVDDFRKMGVRKAAPCHCTGDEALDMFQTAYKDDYIKIGVGRKIVIE